MLLYPFNYTHNFKRKTLYTQIFLYLLDWSKHRPWRQGCQPIRRNGVKFIQCPVYHKKNNITNRINILKSYQTLKKTIPLYRSPLAYTLYIVLITLWSRSLYTIITIWVYSDTSKYFARSDRRATGSSWTNTINFKSV